MIRKHAPDLCKLGHKDETGNVACAQCGKFPSKWGHPVWCESPSSPPRHVVMFSGGVCSWAAAKRVVERHGLDGVVLLFADTKMEDEDLYRFLFEAAANVGAPLFRIAEGRNPWEVMNDEKFIGSSRNDPCSKKLKRGILDKWRNKYCDVETTTVHLGMSWDEPERLPRLQKRVAPWRYEAPMMDRPWISKEMMFERLRDEGIRAPRLYDLGFPHNNCGGFCIKAGKAHFANLLAKLPDRYAYHEAQEQALREKLETLGRGSHSILREQNNRVERAITLKELRERLERTGLTKSEEHEWGGCGCAVE